MSDHAFAALLTFVFIGLLLLWVPALAWTHAASMNLAHALRAHHALRAEKMRAQDRAGTTARF